MDALRIATNLDLAEIALSQPIEMRGECLKRWLEDIAGGIYYLPESPIDEILQVELALNSSFDEFKSLGFSVPELPDALGDPQQFIESAWQFLARVMPHVRQTQCLLQSGASAPLFLKASLSAQAEAGLN